ncbi:MAG: LD-carboxypeptidase [Alphaproteobacteria bacterium]|nr:LD-carboxypeptidase [Alphaproteobacteria bacterium]USO07482.1 MAG: LD-carboxypeptidase [Rhodospirillales bacterium]
MTRPARLAPCPLPAGGTIGICAPSSRGAPDAAGMHILEDCGYRVFIHPQNGLTHHQSAGSAAERAQAINDLFADTGIDAIMAARGGNRVMHALPHLDFAAIVANPKPLIAFSDGTALINAIYARTGLCGYHGPTLSRLGRAQPHEIIQMTRALGGMETTLNWPDAKILKDGRVQGPMIGGNLSMMAALTGTPYMPDTTGAILFLEDVGDQLSRYDRMFVQLRLSGAFEKLAGLVIGQIGTDGDSSVTPFGFTPDEIIAEHIAGLDIPVIVNAPFGHSGPLCTLPIGGVAHLDAGNLTLTF